MLIRVFILCLNLFFCFFLSIIPLSLKGQTTVNGSTNNLEITEVVYEVNGTFYTQDASGDAGDVTAFALGTGEDQDPVRIYRITYTKGGNSFDIYPQRDAIEIFSYAPEITGETAPSAQIAVAEADGMINYDDGGGFSTTGPYATAMERLVAIPDVRAYWTVNSTALGASGSGQQEFISFNFLERGTTTQSFTEPDEVMLITERDGNSPMYITPLDVNGNPISGSTEIQITGASSSYYQWNTTIQNAVDPNGTQPQWLILFENSLFTTGGENIYGLQIELEYSYADGSVVAFRDPNTRITVGDCWRTLSSTPITGATFHDFLDNIWTQGLPGSDYPGAGASNSNVLLWDRSYSGDNETVGWTTTDPRTGNTLNLNHTIETGTGFLLSVFGDDDFDGNDDGFPKTLEVEGRENNGIVKPPMNGNANGWTLLGNPYGAPLDWNEVIGNSNTLNITNVANVYDRNNGSTTNGNNGGWRATNGTGAGEILHDLIAPFQGFFVQTASSGTPVVEMQLDDRAPFDFSIGGANEWEFYGKSKTSKQEHIRLEVEGEGLLNSAWISFTEKGSYNRIKGDAYELMPFSQNYALLSTRKGDELFDIGQFAYDSNVRIPVNLETTKPGTYTIRATRFDIAPGAELMFTDIQENVSIPFDEHFEYEFTVRQAAKANVDPLSCGATAQELAAKFKIEKAKSINSDRFIIQHASAVNAEPGETPSEIKLNQNYPNPFNPATQISYQLPQQSDVLLEVYDLTGKLISTLVNETVSAGIHNVTFDAENLSSGVYVYRLQTDRTVLSRKLTVIK